MSAIPSQFRHIKNSRVLNSILRHQGVQAVGHSREIVSQSSGMEATGRDRDGSSQDINAASFEVTDNSTAPENNDIERNRVPLIRQRKGLARRIHRILTLPGTIVRAARPQLTEEEIEIRERKKAEQAFLKMCKQDVYLFVRRWISRLTQLEFMNILRDGKGRKIVHRVRPGMIVVNGDRTKYMWKPRISTLPAGVSLIDLTKDETLTEIIPSIGMPAKAELKVWGPIFTGFPAGSAGVVSFVPITDMWAGMENMPPLSFVVGMGEDGNKIYKDLDDCPHLLVAGGTGGGKSNFLNGMVCTYIRRLGPDRIRFVMFDLKGGAELGFYENIPHLYKDDVITGIIDTDDQAIRVMQHLQGMMKARIATFKKAGARNFNEYNNKRRGKNKMPAIVVMFDEWADVYLQYKAEAERLIARLTNQARAAGMYFVLSAQNPKAEILTELAKINFHVRIVFSTSMGGSLSVLGDHSARGLGIPGRAVYSKNDENTIVQTPRIPGDLIEAVVLSAITGRPIGRTANIDIEEVLQYALDNMNGFLDIKKLYPHFRGKITHKRLFAMLKAADDKTFVIGGTPYLVTQRQGRSRRMILSDDIDMGEPDTETP